MTVVKFILVYAGMAVLTWYICDGLLWLEFAMKPFTVLGKQITTWVEHAVILVCCLVWTLRLMPKSYRN